MVRLLPTSVVLSACLLGLIVEISASISDTQLEAVAAVRTKRQTVANQRPASDQNRPSTSVGVSGSASATASALSSTTTSDGKLDQPSISSPSGAQPSRRPKRPKVSAPPVGTDSELVEDTEIDDERPAKVKKPRRRRPTNRRPANYDDQEGEDYEDCDDNDYDYGHPRAFHEAATRPMRHFGRMMEGMFSRMRGLTAGDFEGIPGGNLAVASSTSNDDGYSRVSSVVNNNGRTRGIVTETRNGRTKTRRIGSDDEEGDEEE